VVAPNAVDSAEYCVVWPPAVPQEFDHRDADAGNHAKHRNSDEADNGQPELPLLDAEDAAQVCEFSASLFDVDLTHPLLLTNDLDLIAYFVCESNAGRHSFDENKG
jgi:hypothetical protein